MSIEKFSHILINDYKNIRERIINEFNAAINRRDIGNNYLIPTELSKEDFVYADDLNKVYHDLNFVNSDTMPIESVTASETYITPYGVEPTLTIYESKPKVGHDSGCKSGCIGLCQGCVGTCIGGCLQTCSGGCRGCQGTCEGSCQTECVSGCTGCSGTCTGCKGSCTGGCGSGCDGGCDGCEGCGGCGGDCWGSSTGGCGNCTGSCTGCGSCPEGH